MLIALVVFTPARSHAQASTADSDSTIDTKVEAGGEELEAPSQRLLKWNELDGPVTTLRFGFGFLVDGVSYLQDHNSKKQFDLEPDFGLRDFRLLLKGKFKTNRPLSWTLGYMYDGSDEHWHFRQTGIMVGVPELRGSFFVGRTKEGFSLIKVMTGYYIWGVERAPTNDAFVPILADGIKYMGYFPGPRLFVNLGAYDDRLYENEKFATADKQVVVRLGWHPVLSEDKGKVWQVAVMRREFKPDDGKIQPRSRPEAYLAPYFLDAGKFDSDHGRTTGVESFYRAGSWMLGGEYDWQQLDDDTEGGHALFHGGTISVVKEITGETRPYNVASSYFEAIVPKRSVFDGGTGNLEATLTYTYTDFDSGRFHGGKFWRISPMIHWNMSYNLRLSLEYGYGKLDRFGLDGATQFLQFRILTML
jgi:phosphate-selective porin OprO/OprP